MKDSLSLPGAGQSTFLDDVALTDAQKAAARATLTVHGHDDLAPMLGLEDVA